MHMFTVEATADYLDAAAQHYHSFGSNPLKIRELVPVFRLTDLPPGISTSVNWSPLID
jgi:hypothetical protein